MPRVTRVGRAPIVALAGLLFAVPVLSQDASDPRGERRALLIGINEYQVLPDLRGAVNDLDVLEQVLTTRFAFPARNIQRLTDAGATRSAILATLRAFVEGAGPNDLVYIHYSGHGSQAADTDGDEEDGQDETLVPHDGRTSGVPDITDDELAEIFAGLTTSHAVIAMDSCHSGTATRGVSAFRTRWVPPDDRTALYEKVRTRAVVPVPESRYVVLTGAASNEKALDGPVEGTSHGLFSFALAKSLAAAEQGATPLDIFRGIQRELERIKGQLGLFRMPEPQLEGPRAKLETALLVAPEPENAPAPEAALPFLTTERLEDGRVRLTGAAAQGAPGSVWALYSADDLAFAAGTELAHLTVVEATADGLLAEANPADGVPEEGRAVLLAAAPPAPVVEVHVEEGEGTSALVEALEEQLPEAQRVEAQEDFARFYVELEEGGAVVYGADHEQEIARIEGNEPAKLASELSRLFSRSMTVAELLSLENPSSRIQLEVETGREDGAADFRVRRGGEPRTPENSLQISVRTSHDCRITVIDVDSAGTVSAVFPNALSEKAGFYPGGQLAAGEVLRIPDSLAPGNRAAFYADFAPPAGIDTLRVFCTTDAETANVIRESVAGLATATRSAVRSTLVGRLRELLIGQRTRGLRIVAAGAPGPGGTAAELDPVPDWTAASITLRVLDGSRTGGTSR